MSENILNRILKGISDKISENISDKMSDLYWGFHKWGTPIADWMVYNGKSYKNG